MSVRHFLDVTDLSARDLNAVLTLAQVDISKLGRPLADKGVALIFEKPSNRTRHSMEMAVVQLGGNPIFTRGEEVGFDDGGGDFRQFFPSTCNRNEVQSNQIAK